MAPIAIFLITLLFKTSTSINVNGQSIFRLNHNNFVHNNFSSRINRTPITGGFIFHLLKQKFKNPVLQRISTPQPIVDCICVPFYQCNSNNTVITDGSGLVDVRLLVVTMRRCTGDIEVCCRLPSRGPVPIGIPTVPPPTPTMRPSTTTTTMSPPTTTTTTTMKPTLAPTTTTTTMMPTRPPTTSPSLMCICVPPSLCDSTGYMIISGEGLIDPRQTANSCPKPGEICCKIRPTTNPTTSSSLIDPRESRITCICTAQNSCPGNGYIITSETGMINPRYPILRQGQVEVVTSGCVAGLTQICCRYSSNVAEASSSINFPIGSSQPLKNSVPTISVVKNSGTSDACGCVKNWQCSDGHAINLDGVGIIDPRFDACPSTDEICCRLRGIGTRNLINGNSGNSPEGIDNVQNIDNQLPGAGKNNNFALFGKCGIRGTTCLYDQSCATKSGETSFAEFPWTVALLIRNPNGQSTNTSAIGSTGSRVDSLTFLCGASIINTRSILTAAHCVIDHPSGVLVARFGEWNTANIDEPAPYQESDIKTVVTHPLYYRGALYNDIAVLILKTAITYAANVMPICLPHQGMTFSPGTLCWASGWGRNAFEGQYHTTMRKIDLPIVERSRCQTRLRATKLGEYFQLHGSFICAGGESNKDTCRGDGGGPLVCPTATGQYIQAGIVSWGIGCGESKTPAVYASVSLFRQWIDQQLANHGVL